MRFSSPLRLKFEFGKGTGELENQITLFQSVIYFINFHLLKLKIMFKISVLHIYSTSLINKLECLPFESYPTYGETIDISINRLINDSYHLPCLSG